MPTYEYPALGFDPAPGDPGAIARAAQASARFAARLDADVAALRRLTAVDWRGNAATAFTGTLGQLPPDLTRARDAYHRAAQLLAGHADRLAAGQQRARQLEAEAAEALRQHRIAVADAEQLRARYAMADPTQRPPIGAAYQASQARAQTLTDRVAQLRAQAHQLHDDLDAAAETTAARLRGAARPPYERPSWWRRAWSGFLGWVRDNAGTLRTISGVLKLAAMAAAVLSFVPVVGIFFGPIALGLGALALATDVALKLATGEGTWAMLGLDAALTLIPGGRLTRIVGAPFAAGGRLVARAAPEFARAVATAAGATSRGVQYGVAQASRLLPRTRAWEGMAGEINDLPAAVGRWSRGHAPQAMSATPAERRFSGLIANGQTPEAAWQGLTRGERLSIRQVQASRFWANTDHLLATDAGFASRYGHLFSDAERAALPGRAPTHFDPVTGTTRPMELSHEPLSLSAGGGTQIPRATWQHAALDPARHYPGESYLSDWLRSGRLSPLPQWGGTTPADQGAGTPPAAPAAARPAAARPAAAW